MQRQNYAASAISVFNLRVSLDFWRFAVPFLITPLLAALSKRLAVFLHNSCAVSTLPSLSAVSACLSTVRSVDLRCRLRMRFFSSARACFLADCLCKTDTPFENLLPRQSHRQPRFEYPSQCVYLMIPQNSGFVYFFLWLSVISGQQSAEVER